MTKTPEQAAITAGHIRRSVSFEMIPDDTELITHADHEAALTALREELQTVTAERELREELAQANIALGVQDGWRIAPEGASHGQVLVDGPGGDRRAISPTTEENLRLREELAVAKADARQADDCTAVVQFERDGLKAEAERLRERCELLESLLRQVVSNDDDYLPLDEIEAALARAKSPPPASLTKPELNHCIQYAYVGSQIVVATENMSDDEVRSRVGFWAKVERFDRCPECEVWTRQAGKLRTEIDCPAVKAALEKSPPPAASEGQGP